MTFATDTAIVAGEWKPPAGRTQLNLTEDALLTRADVALALTEAGFPVSAATLATKAVRGGGPPYQLFGRKPLYRWGPSLSWAQGRLSEPASSSSEHGARAA
jgi:alkylation response protein AidB-like acyl-CoA dehydrogenase